MVKLGDQKPGGGEDIYLLVRSERQILLDCLADFRKTHPGAVFHLSHDYVDERISRFDIIIDDASVDYEGFQSIPIIRENIRIAASRDNPLCSSPCTGAAPCSASLWIAAPGPDSGPM